MSKTKTKQMTVPEGLCQPTRQSVQNFIKSMFQRTRWAFENMGWLKLKALESELQAREDYLLSKDRLYQEMKKEITRLEKICQEERRKVCAATERVNNMFLTQGLTKEVVKELQKLERYVRKLDEAAM